MRFAKTRNTSRVLRPAPQNRRYRHVQSAAPATKTATHLYENVAKVLRQPRKTTFDTLPNTSEWSRSATPCHAKRSNAICETSKSLQNLSRHGHTRLARTVADGCGRFAGSWRTVANGCGWLRTVANGCGWLRNVDYINATTSEHTLNPQTPRVKWEPLLRIRGKKGSMLAHPC